MAVAAAVLAAHALLAVPTASAAKLFGLLSTGELFSSMDDGLNWNTTAALPIRDGVALAARFSSIDLFLASRSGSIYRSTDGAIHWTAVGTVTAQDVVDMAIRPDGALLVLTSAGSVHLSTDLGASFQGIATLTGSNFVSLVFTTPAVNYYALARTGEVYESGDGGVTWAPKAAIPVSDARCIRAIQSSLYVLTEAGTVLVNSNQGTTWTPIGTLSQVGMRGLVRNGAALMAASREGNVAMSTDGASWTWRGTMSQVTLTALASNEPAWTAVEPLAGSDVLVGEPFPNPSFRGLSLALRLEHEATVGLALYDLAGRLISDEGPRRYTPGESVLAWEPRVRMPGTYFLRVRVGGSVVATRIWAAVR